MLYSFLNLSFLLTPGDKIVTVNGKSLSGLTYRESTDFIRQCPGPNVKMGIIKHALYKKEGIIIFSQELAVPVCGCSGE
jgi:C-terminal processing protease CtpA/Prc